MSLRKLALVGLIAVVAVAGKLLIKTLPFVAGAAAGRAAVSFFGTPAVEQEMRSGFEEISPDWEGWLGLWQDSSESAFRVAGARITALHLTEDELLHVYRYRASLMTEVADDPTRNPICGPNALNTLATAETPDIDVTPVARVLGRGFARQYLGRQPWQPPFDLTTNEAIWSDFIYYLDEKERGFAADAFIAIADGIDISNSEMCTAQAALYELAAVSPEERLGAIRYLDFVRSLDALAFADSEERDPFADVQPVGGR